MIQQKSLDQKNLGLQEVLDAVIANTIKIPHKEAYVLEVQNNINFRVLFHVMNLAAHKTVHPQVNAIANKKLKDLKVLLLGNGKDLYSLEIIRRIDRFFSEPEDFKVIPASKIPDGSPIGMDCF